MHAADMLHCVTATTEAKRESMSHILAAAAATMASLAACAVAADGLFCSHFVNC